MIYLECFNSIISSIINFMKHFLAPLRTYWTGFRISKMSKSIESKINKNQFFITQISGNFSKCVQFRMHIIDPISQLYSSRMSLEYILPNRNNLALVNNQRNMFLLSLHCHRQWFSDRKKQFINRVYIQFNPSSTSASNPNLPTSKE